MSSDINSVDLDLLLDALQHSAGLIGRDDSNGIRAEYAAFVTKYEQVVAGCADGISQLTQKSPSNFALLLNQWVATDTEGQAVHDILVENGLSGNASFSGGPVLDYLNALGVERSEIDAEPGELIGLPPTSGYADDPICTANGNFVHQETDIGFVGFAQAINAERTYNAMAAGQSGVFGQGWSSLLDMRVDVDSLGAVRVRLADGATVPFSRGPDGAFLPNHRRRLQVEQDDREGTWRLTNGVGAAWEFDTDGALTGGSVDFASFRIERSQGSVRVSEARSGRWVQYQLGDDGQVASAASSDGRRATYSYVEGHCVGVERPAGAASYVVEDGLISTITDADGVVACRNTYDRQGRVASQANAHGRLATYEYLEGRVTRVSYGPDGPTNLFAHDRRGNVTAMFGADGTAMRMAWDGQNRMIRIVDRSGNETRYEFDPDENSDRLITRTDPDGLRETYEYDEAGRVVREVDRAGVAQRLHYDGAATVPSRLVEADSSETTASYNDCELPTKVIDADGVASELMWDDDGQLVAVISSTGARSSFVYDRAGRLARLTDPMGKSTSFRYDDGGRLVSTTDPAGTTYDYAYSPAGRMLSCASVAPGSWSASYNSAGLADSFVDAIGAVTRLSYDDFGNVVERVEPDGAIYRQTFDALGQLLSITEPTGAVTSYEYDRAGNLIAAVDADGLRWQRQVDQFGRTLAIVAPNGSTYRWRYHPNGELAAFVRPDGGEFAYVIDEVGRLVAETDPNGNTTRYSYSPGGRLTSCTTAAGREYRLVNDAHGRLVSAVDPDGETVTAVYRPDGQVAEFKAEGGTTTIRYDETGRVTGWSSSDAGEGPEAIFTPASAQLKRAGTAPALFTWDKRGLLASVRDPASVATEFVRNVRGQVIELATGASRTGFSYDAAGRVGSVTDPLGVTTSYERSPAGRLMGVDVAGQFRTRYAYDEGGEFASATDESGNVLVTVAREHGLVVEATNAHGSVSIGRDRYGVVSSTRDLTGNMTVYDRDADGMVTRRRDGDGTEVSYRRSPSGDLLGFGDSSIGDVDLPQPDANRAKDAAGRIVGDSAGRTYRYDAAGRLEEALGADGQRWAFSYNDLGLLATDTSPQFGQRRFTYNLAGAVERIEADNGTWTDFTYDIAGRRTSETRSDGTSVQYHWDGLDHLTSIVRTDATGHAETTEIIYSGFGRVERIGDVPIGWDDGMYGKPVRVGDQRYLRSGTHVLPCVAGASWSDGVVNDPFGYRQTSGDPYLGYRGELTFDGLVFMGDRVYDPTSRTFLSRDPLAPVPGQVSFAGAYTYAYNDPVNYLDPSGRQPLTQEAFEAKKAEMERTAWDKYGKAVLTVTSLVLDFVPVVGNVKGLIEGIVGYDMAGNKLAAWERGLGLLGPLGKGAKMAGKVAVAAGGAYGAYKGVKNSRKVLKTATKLYDKTSDGLRSIRKLGARLPGSHGDDFVDLYHGTSANNAASIRANGIDLSRSRKQLDFGSGFYTTADPEQAADWVKRLEKQGESGEVLHYRVRKADLEALNGRTFEGATQEWEDMVRSQRRLGSPPHDLDYVQGPMVGRVKGLRDNGPLDPWGHQLSIHTQTAADLLNGGLQ